MRSFLTILAVVLILSLVPGTSAQVDALGNLDILLTQAASLLDNGDLGSAQALIGAALVFINDDLLAECDRLSAARSLLEQAVVAETVEGASALLTAARALLAECGEPSAAATPAPTVTATPEPTVTPTPTPAANISSVCLVTGDIITEASFDDLAFRGIQRAAEVFSLETLAVESISPADYMPNIEVCLDTGPDVVVTVGFLMTDATLQAATDNPDVSFIGVDQFFDGHPDNLVGLQYREDQAGFVVGAMAALMTETGTIAGVYGIEIPAVVKFRNGFEQGARYINPGITILGTYTDSFVDPAAGAAIAQAFLSAGADVLFAAGGATGSGAIRLAAEEGAFVIGVDVDEYFSTFGAGEVAGAQNLITSAIKRVDNGVYAMIAALAGDPDYAWPGGDLYTLEAANRGIGFAPAHEADVPDAVRQQVTEVLELLASGDLDTGVDPITGELLDSGG